MGERDAHLPQVAIEHFLGRSAGQLSPSGSIDNNPQLVTFEADHIVDGLAVARDPNSVPGPEAIKRLEILLSHAGLQGSKDLLPTRWARNLSLAQDSSTVE
jgi:hypothetical protein